MDTQPDKNKQKEARARIQALEDELKIAFKGEKFEAVTASIKSIRALDPQNRLAELIEKKAKTAKKQADLKARENKVKDYKVMLKKLLRDHDTVKLKELAVEFGKFDPENKIAKEWLQKAEKLEVRLAPKKKEEKKEIKAIVQEAPKPVVEAKKPSFLSGLFKKKEVAKSVITSGTTAKPAEVKPTVAPTVPPVVLKEVPKEVPKEAPKAVAEPVKENKPAFLSGLFKKSETKPVVTSGTTAKPAEVKPTVAPTVPPVVLKEVPKAVTEVKKPEVKPLVTQPTLAKPAEVKPAELPKGAPAGNIFTKMFGKKEEETKNKSIIDTIVASGDQKEKKIAPGIGVGYSKPEKPKDAAGLLTFSKVFMNFAILFIALSAAFLYVEWVDKSNTMLSLVGIPENTGAKLYSAAEEVKTLTQKEADLNKEVELYKSGYDDKTFATVQKITAARVNWPDIFAKIKEVTNSVYELNDFFKYIEYNNYAFDAENGTVRVTGTLSDPLGRNLTKLVELEQAFENFPKDQNNPDDKTKPYFTGFKEFTTFSKSLDEATGRYNSSFQLAFSLNK